MLHYINYVGSVMVLILLAYVIADIINMKKVTLNGIIGRVIVIVVFFFILLRTK